MSSLGDKLIGGAIWTAGAAWVSNLIALGVFVALTRFLTPQEFGLATLAMLPVFFLSVLVTTGIPDALVQRREIDRAHLNSAFWLLAAIGFVLSGLIWICAGLIARFFRQPELEPLLGWSCVVVAIESLAVVPGAVLKRELGFRKLALRTLLATATSAALAVAMAAFGCGAWSVIGYQVTKTCVGTTLVFLGSGWRPLLSYSHARCRDLLPFASPIVAQSVLAFANNELPAFVLGVFLGPAAVGVYSFARRPFQVLWDVFLTPLMGLIVPTVARIQDDPEKIDRFFNTALRMTALCAFPIFIGFAAVAPVAVPFIFGAQWSGAVAVVAILTPLAILKTIDALCASTILALGYSALVLKLRLVFIILAAAPVIAAARLSAEALATAVLLCNLAVLPLMLFFARWTARVDVRKSMGIFLKLAVVSLLMFVAARAAQLNAPAHAPQLVVLAFAILAGGAVYIAGAVGLVRADLEQFRMLMFKTRRWKTA